MTDSPLLSPESEARVEHARIVYLRVITVIVTVAALLLGWGVLTLIGIAHTNKTNGYLLVQCTTPPLERKPPVELKPGARDCYQRSLDSQAAISNITVIAAACGAANPGDIEKTRTCVEKALTEARKKP